MKYVVIQSNNQNFALPITDVQYIERVQPITELPKTADFLLGVTDIRGNLYPVVDLKQKLFFKKAEVTEDSRIVIAKYNKKVSFLVDAATDVIEFESNQFQELSTNDDQPNDKFINGVLSIDDQLYISLNLESLIKGDELN